MKYDLIPLYLLSSNGFLCQAFYVGNLIKKVQNGCLFGSRYHTGRTFCHFED